jgi:hypothetical protein
MPSPGTAKGACHGPRWQTADEIAPELIGLLHQQRPAEEFAALPRAGRGAARCVQRKSGLVERCAWPWPCATGSKWQQRESGMLAVIESARTCRAGSTCGAAARHRARARKLLGSHLCWLSIYDAACGEFQVAWPTAPSRRTGKMTAPAGTWASSAS